LCYGIYGLSPLLFNMGAEAKCGMAAVAVLSTGPLTGLDSCRNDVLTFLEALSWQIAIAEVKMWAPDGLPLGFRKWEAETMDIWNLAEEIAHFITDSAAGGATVLLRRRTGRQS
jgi:hypothetical protein